MTSPINNSGLIDNFATLTVSSTITNTGFFDGFDTVEVVFLNPSSGNVICLGENEVVVNIAENGVTASALADQGVTVWDMDLSEFRKGAGGPTCLTLPLERG